MLERAVAAIKENEANAVDCSTRAREALRTVTFTVLCANASSGIITASPTSKGAQLRTFRRGKKG